MLDSIYHMTNTLESHFWRKNVIILLYLHFHCESLNEPLHLRRGSYLHEQIGLSHTHIRAI